MHGRRKFTDPLGKRVLLNARNRCACTNIRGGGMGAIPPPPNFTKQNEKQTIIFYMSSNAFFPYSNKYIVLRPHHKTVPPPPPTNNYCGSAPEGVSCERETREYRNDSGGGGPGVRGAAKPTVGATSDLRRDSSSSEPHRNDRLELDSAYL
uniref:Uncharacterized protein n=1 Tax=Sipha flava TaxID=143950 RepID=A0A2S2PXU0_9HEMI